MAPMEVVDGIEPAAAASSLDFSLTHQEVELDIDFTTRTITGTTVLTVQPLTQDLRSIALNCRQICVTGVAVEGHKARMGYDDPYDHLMLRKEYDIHQHHLMSESLGESVKEFPDGELVVKLPPKVKIKELSAAELLAARGQDAENAVEGQLDKAIEEGGTMFKPITVRIAFKVENARDAIHWVGLAEGDERFPHVYTRHHNLPGSVGCFVFPCVDALSARCTWSLALRCPRTLGDLKKPDTSLTKPLTNGGHSSNTRNGHDGEDQQPRYYLESSNDDESALELLVVSSGYMEDSDAPGEIDLGKRKWIFHTSTPVSAHFIGFAIGPFEQVDLSDMRESALDDKLGDSAVRLHAFCLPGRVEEVENTCQPLVMALDHFTEVYGSYPFHDESTSHKLCFVDDLPRNVLDMASLSLCSTRLLFPLEIQDNMFEKVRELVHALANQWLGVNIVPNTENDYWIIVGGSYFMADSFMSKLCGRNETRFRHRQTMDRVVELDIKRPSLYGMGPYVSLDSSNLEFMVLKAPLIFFILDNRIIKASGRNGVGRMFWKLFLDAKIGKISSNEVTTDAFIRICEKVGHAKLDAFFNQWVYGSGCPKFAVGQKFNKKKMVVEMIITQNPVQSAREFRVDADNFMREVKEHEGEVWAGEVQPVFTGPMTIRVIELDGTPYEHIVDIREGTVKFDIPYNTKYKRNKLKKRQKDTGGDGDDASDRRKVHRLGNIFPDEDDEAVATWRLKTWSEDDLRVMREDFAEWVRIDKDFEWICKIEPAQPVWMHASQLQQDSDVVAHMESVRYFQTKPHYMGPTLLLRTLMDDRYFYGIRIMAAEALVTYATPDPEHEWVGLFHLIKAFSALFCLPNTAITRTNDFSNRALYLIQCAIPRALARIRDTNGRTPQEIRTFFVDKMKFNDNATNEFSDSYYLATLMSCMAHTFVSTRDFGALSFDFSDDFEQESLATMYQKVTMDELERHRRIDEWIPSYQNIYTQTAIDCMALLVREKATPKRIADFMKYTKPGNSDTVRYRAFKALVDLGTVRIPEILGYMVFSFSAEPSPYMRDRLWDIIGRAFGLIATTAPPERSKTNGEFGIDEGNIERRQEAFARHTVEGATKSLKDQLGNDVLLQDTLLAALRSPLLGIKDVIAVLDICNILYDTKDSFVLRFRLPRFWAVQHLGHARLRFFQTQKIREKPLQKLDIKSLKRTRTDTDVVNGALARSHSPEAKRRKLSDPTITPKKEKPASVVPNGIKIITKPRLSDVKPPPITPIAVVPDPFTVPISSIMVASPESIPDIAPPPAPPKIKTSNHVSLSFKPKPKPPASENPLQKPPKKPKGLVVLKFPHLRNSLARFPAGVSGKQSPSTLPRLITLPAAPPVKMVPPPPKQVPESAISAPSPMSAVSMDSLPLSQVRNGIGGLTSPSDEKKPLKLKIKFGSKG